MVAQKIVRKAAKYVNVNQQSIFVTMYATILQQFLVLAADVVDWWPQYNFCNYNSVETATQLLKLIGNRLQTWSRCAGKNFVATIIQSNLRAKLKIVQDSCIWSKKLLTGAHAHTRCDQKVR